MTTNTSPFPSSPPSTKATYSGSCHCSLITFTMTTTPPLPSQKIVSCNCSHCHIKGYLWCYPQKTDITFSPGSEDQLTEYQFHTRRISHFFCPKCGTGLVARSNDPELFLEQMGVNVRTLAGVDIDALEIQKLDGKKF